MKKEYIIEEMTDEELWRLVDEIEFQLMDLFISLARSQYLLDLRNLATKELQKRGCKCSHLINL